MDTELEIKAILSNIYLSLKFYRNKYHLIVDHERSTEVVATGSTLTELIENYKAKDK